MIVENFLVMMVEKVRLEVEEISCWLVVVVAIAFFVVVVVVVVAEEIKYFLLVVGVDSLL